MYDYRQTLIKLKEHLKKNQALGNSEAYILALNFILNIKNGLLELVLICLVCLMKIESFGINVMFISAVWTLILTAPIHCSGSIAEQVLK